MVGVMMGKKNMRNQVRCLQYNIGDGPNHKKLEDLETFVKEENPDVFALDEHADRDSVTDAFIGLHPEFGKWAGDGRPGALKTCILYRKKLGKLTGEYSKTLVGPRHLPPGAGPENAGAKVANRIRMRINKRRVHFIAVHQYASVRSRWEAAKDLVDALVHLVRNRFGVVVVLGDMNANPMDRIYKALRELLPFFSKPGATHGKRTIDVIWVNKLGRILKAWTRSGTSDHEAVIADVIF